MFQKLKYILNKMDPENYFNTGGNDESGISYIFGESLKYANIGFTLYGDIVIIYVDNKDILDEYGIYDSKVLTNVLSRYGVEY